VALPILPGFTHVGGIPRTLCDSGEISGLKSKRPRDGHENNPLGSPDGIPAIIEDHPEGGPIAEGLKERSEPPQVVSPDARGPFDLKRDRGVPPGPATTPNGCRHQTAAAWPPWLRGGCLADLACTQQEHHGKLAEMNLQVPPEMARKIHGFHAWTVPCKTVPDTNSELTS
jgi:hypothetical protein